MTKYNSHIPFGKPLVGKKEIESVTSVLKSGIYVHGNKCLEFENSFKRFTKAKYSISVSSCTAGMHLIYFSLGIGKGDEVIVPAQTHTATAHAIELTGAKPVFVDCEKKTGNIDTKKISKFITKKTKAICVVHFLGIPVKMKLIKAIAKKYKLFVLEDCALSVGAKHGSTHTGLLGDAGVFSFYPVKHMTTGEGGIIITNNKKLAYMLKNRRALGINKNYQERKIAGFYDAVNLGFNYRMSEIHAAIGTEQLKKLPFFLKERKFNFNFLKKNLKKIKNIEIIDSDDINCKSSYYSLSLVLEGNLKKYRNFIIEQLKKYKIGSSIYYPQPVPRMTYYKKKYGYKRKNFLNASRISDFSISLPVGPHLLKKDLLKISSTIKKIFMQLND